MWGKDDYFGRCVQLFVGLGCVGLLFVDGVMVRNSPDRGFASGAEGCAGLGLLYLAARYLWYAISGRDNINRDNF